jgi:hypothetical protein
MKINFFNLMAKYFSELDRYYEQSESTALAIARSCSDPLEIAGLEYRKFVRKSVRLRGAVDWLSEKDMRQE